jgi:heme A synthase
VVAVLVALGLVRHALYFTSQSRTRLPARAVVGIASFQLLAGVANVLLSAPGWLQVVHLALALGLWISYVTLAAFAREPRHAGALGVRADQGLASG